MRSNNAPVLAFLCALLLHSIAHAETPDPIALATAALEKLDATDLDADWYFTLDIVEGEERRIVKSDPQRDLYERRQLVLVDDEAPDKAQLSDFRDAEKKRIDDIDPDATGYRYLVDVQTLQVLERGEGYLKYSFKPRVKALEESRDSLSGTVLLKTQSRQIEAIEIHNTAALSPAFSVTVKTFLLAFTFAPEQDENLLQTLESRAVGKAGFLKRFDSHVEIAFSEYRRQEP